MTPSESERISKAFYDVIGPEGLAARTREDWDRQIVDALCELLPKGVTILDVGCGYGRIAIPLAKRGHHVIGIDLSERLIEEARRRVADEQAAVHFRTASMQRMPFEDASFDVVLCLWSAFHELLQPVEQLAAIHEMHRVLRPDGWALIEGPRFVQATDEEIKSGKRYGDDHRIAIDLIQGHPNPHFQHDESSYRKLIELAGINTFAICDAEWAGRLRLFLRFGRD